VWLWDELHGVPHRPWQPCLQCGRPIEAPSRAWYCSPRCRQLARQQRERLNWDELARACAPQPPCTSDSSFGDVPF
jgi:hypothetical protein